jgi:hypothetical protein
MTVRAAQVVPVRAVLTGQYIGQIGHRTCGRACQDRRRRRLPPDRGNTPCAVKSWLGASRLADVLPPWTSVPARWRPIRMRRPPTPPPMRVEQGRRKVRRQRAWPFRPRRPTDQVRWRGHWAHPHSAAHRQPRLVRGVLRTPLPCPSQSAPERPTRRCDIRHGAKPARVEAIDVRFIVTKGVPVERLDPRPAVATSCRFSIRLPRSPRYRSPWRRFFGPVRWMVRRQAGSRLLS